jgi:beta-lactamase regulating signal transducer with metallopeptidase domain/predicted  nucleic acid-binding Zn-ribbon protein
MAIESAVVAALGWALLDFVWQGLLVGALAALGLLALRRARPQARYALACIALGACLLLPAAGVMRNLKGAYSESTAESTALASPLALAFASAPAAAAAPGFDWRGALQEQMPALVAAWSAGALLLALRLLLGWGWVGRLRAGARLPDSRWQGRFDELAVHVGLKMPVPLRISDALGTPVAAGWWRPMVLVPAALVARMPTELLEALLAHELAHVRRRDYLVNLLQGAVETLLFYHPVVWWLSARVRVEREQIADDLASRAIGDPRRLALALQALDAFQREHALSGAAPLPRTPRLVLAAHGGSLMSRIQRLVRPDPQRPDWKLALPLASLAALGIAVHAVAAPAVAPVPAITPVTAATPALAPTPVTAATPATAPMPVVAATPATAPTPALAATAVTGSITLNGGNHEAYAMVRAGEDGMMLSGDLDDIGEVKRVRQHLHSDFMWFRHDGKTYVLQDPATLAAARRAWAPAEEMGERMEVLGKQMEPLGKRMEALGKQMESLSDDGEPYARQMEALSKRMEPLAEQQAELGEKMQELAASRRDVADDARIEAQMAQLQRKMEPLQSQMETLSHAMQEHSAAMQRAQLPMQEMSRRMQEASKPMEDLGRQMDALSKRQEPLVEQADAEVRRLIEQALREGKAVPAREVTR